MVLIPMMFAFVVGLTLSGFPVGYKIGKGLGYGKKGRILWSLGFGLFMLATAFLSFILPVMISSGFI